MSTLQVKTSEDQQKSVKRLLKKEQDRRRKIAALGIDYEFPGYVSKVFCFIIFVVLELVIETDLLNVDYQVSKNVNTTAISFTL